MACSTFFKAISKNWVGSFKRVDWGYALWFIPLYGQFRDIWNRSTGNLSSFDLASKILKIIKKKLENGEDVHETALYIIGTFKDNKKLRTVRAFQRPTKRVEIFVGGWYGFVVERETDGKFIDLIA